LVNDQSESKGVTQHMTTKHIVHNYFNHCTSFIAPSLHFVETEVAVYTIVEPT